MYLYVTIHTVHTVVAPCGSLGAIQSLTLVHIMALTKPQLAHLTTSQDRVQFHPSPHE